MKQRPFAKRLRRLLAKASLVVGGIIIGLFLVEIALRLYGFTYFNPYIVDRDVGYSLRPGAEGWWTREGRTFIKINSHGFRDRERVISKPPDTFRIAVLGDSFAEAFQVPLEKTFWSIMEERIPQCRPAPQLKVEVLNFGVSGFSTARELILLQQRVWQYSPDLVVLLFTPGNDVRDNSRLLSRNKDQPLPYFVFENGNVVLDDSLLARRNSSLTFRLQQSFAGRVFSWLRDHLRILGLIYTVREATLSRTAEDRQRELMPTEPGMDSAVYRQPATAEWDEAWRVTEALLVRMRDEVQMRGAKFLLVTGSSSIQVLPHPELRAHFMNQLGVNDLSYPEARLNHWGNAQHFKVMNLSPRLYEYANTNQVYLHGNSENGGKGHWNETGHRLVGELIAQEICRDNFQASDRKWTKSNQVLDSSLQRFVSVPPVRRRRFSVPDVD